MKKRHDVVQQMYDHVLGVLASKVGHAPTCTSKSGCRGGSPPGASRQLVTLLFPFRDGFPRARIILDHTRGRRVNRNEGGSAASVTDLEVLRA